MAVTENTINDLVSEFLRSCQVDALREITGRISDGLKRPDFELRYSDKVYYGEGEWLRSFHDLGIVQAANYGDIPGTSGYFAIGYPETLRKDIAIAEGPSSRLEIIKEANIKFYFKVEGKFASPQQLKVKDLPGAIASIITKGLEQIDVSDFTDFVRDLVDRLATFIPRSKKSPKIFEHVIATIPQQAEEEETARRAAAYLLVDQIIFYRILSVRGEGYQLMVHKDVNSVGVVQSYFDEVLKQDYQAIFSTKVTSLFSQKATKFIADLIRVVNDMQPEEFNRDLLGSIFHKLIPREVRKPVAAYYTHPWAARLLARLASISGDMKALDLACGSGTLLVAAYEQKASRDTRPAGQERHARYLNREITGIDIMPFPAHLAAVQLALQNPQHLTNKLRIGIDDSTHLKPGSTVRTLTIEAISPQKSLKQFGDDAEPDNKVKRGAIGPSGAGTPFRMEKADIVLMNPPFTRKQYIDPEHRKELTSLFKRYSKYINNEMGYYGYFILLADKFLKPRGKLAMVLPAAILRQDSMSGIRRFLHERFTIEYIVAAGWRSAFSDSTSLREILLLARKGGKSATPAKTSFLQTAPQESNLDMLVSQIMEGRSSSHLQISTIPQAEFNNADWLPLVPGLSLEHLELDIPSNAPVTNLKWVSGLNLIQGLRMDASSDFMNTTDSLISMRRKSSTRIEWEIERENSKNITVKKGELTKLSIPKSAIAPANRTLSGISQILLSHSLDWAVIQRFPGDLEFWHTQKNIEKMLLKRRRHVKSRTGKIILAGYGNVDLCAPGTFHLAILANPEAAPTWSCWIMNVPTYDDAKILTLWWNSTFHLTYLLHKRTDVRGSVVKWRKEILMEAPVLSPTRMGATLKQDLIEAFDSFANKDFPCLLDQYTTAHELRYKLDLAVGKALGLSSDNLRPRLTDVYIAISRELEEMLTTMRGDKQ
jgi:hypothetical protein